jgi:hypothetical protein
MQDFSMPNEKPILRTTLAARPSFGSTPDQAWSTSTQSWGVRPKTLIYLQLFWPRRWPDGNAPRPGRIFFSVSLAKNINYVFGENIRKKIGPGREMRQRDQKNPKETPNCDATRPRGFFGPARSAGPNSKLADQTQNVDSFCMLKPYMNLVFQQTHFLFVEKIFIFSQISTRASIYITFAIITIDGTRP